ncbi:GntR family transcriptional regulator [Amaricoccus sp. W119]|uniref:GntR family transcriptional regulator n=1 Tax=Amaricoccus sp. W119 TaxID=3391833 RepID=UPI0039A453BA
MEVAEELKAAIISTRIGLGETLSEERVASQLGVSRTPVREAFSILQHQGLLTVLPRRGSVVFRPNARDIEMLVDFRRQIELGAAKLAIRNAPAEMSKALHDVITRMEVARSEHDILAYTTCDGDFHATFFEYCDNIYYQQAHELIAGRISALRSHLSVPLRIYTTRTHDEHLEICRAVDRGNEATLLSVLEKHIAVMAENYVKALPEL